MNNLVKVAVVAVVSIVCISSLQSISSAAGIADGARKKGIHIEGKVTSFDPSTGIITIHNKKESTDTTATVTATTKITQLVNIGISGLTVGDKVSAQSKDDITAGGTSVEAARITLISPLAEPKKHEGKKSVEGTITTLTPAIVISDDSGADITVGTTPDTKVYAEKPAAISDIATGKRVQIVGKETNGTLVASSLTIQAAHGRKNSSD